MSSNYRKYYNTLNDVDHGCSFQSSYAKVEDISSCSLSIFDYTELTACKMTLAQLEINKVSKLAENALHGGRGILFF